VEGLVMETTRKFGDKVRPYVPWTPEEIDLLRAHWPTGGQRVCQALFPERSPDSIRGKADALGIRILGRAPWVRQPTSEWIDAQIRREYATGAPRLKNLASHINRHVGWIKWRAGELGVRRTAGTTPYLHWLPEEDAILEAALDDECSVGQMQRRLREAGYLRTPQGIRRRVWENHGGVRRSHYTPGEVATLFGVHYDTVYKWIAKGKMDAQRKPGLTMTGLTEGPGNHQITPQAISRFMRQHVAAWDHRKMRKEVLVDFLIGQDKALGRLDELREARAA